MVYFLPYGIQQKIIKSLTLPTVYEKTIDYLKSNYDCDNKELLIISDNPNLYMTHQYAAVNFTYANQHTVKIIDHYYRNFKHVVIFQKFNHLFRHPSVNNRLEKEYKLQEKGVIKINPSK